MTTPPAADTGAIDPLLAKRLRFQQATPFAQAIGLQLLNTGHGTATTRLPPTPQNRTTAENPAIHPLALIGMADHALSYAFATRIPPTSGLSTLDLRLDFGPHPVGAVTAIIALTRMASHNGTATLAATDEAGQPVLGATALFNFRTFPGGSATLCRPDLPRFEIDHAGPFPDLLGLHNDNESTWLEGGARRTVGFEGLPALHGGVIGALLAAACENAAAHLPTQMRLTTLNIRFLRPGTLARLNATASHTRAGRSAAFFTAVCFHNDAEPVADAQATFTPIE